MSRGSGSQGTGGVRPFERAVKHGAFVDPVDAGHHGDGAKTSPGATPDQECSLLGMTMAEKRPVVGVSGNAYLIEEEYPVQASGVHNLEAIAEVAGAIALILPSLPHVNLVDELLEVCDGFVFTGGQPNVHPEEYGELPTDAHGRFDRNRDRVALPLIRAAVEVGKPVLGICRGFQEMNVAYGGTLHPEIREIPGRMNHRMPPDGTLTEKFAHRHEVALEEGSIFARIFGTNRVVTNSLHGQGNKEPGSRILVEGRAPDGTPEAIRVRGAGGFALAVQWHPEWNASNDAVSRPLYEAFGRALRGKPVASASLTASESAGGTSREPRWEERTAGRR